MRDPERIARIIKKLEKVWQRNPDWRLGQLVSNILGAGIQDVFHTQDEEWEKMINAILLND